jgi:soluble lytic murein transglycosylase
MALAYARLAEKDPAAAKRAVDDAVAREAAEPFYVSPHPALKSAAFQRAVELVRQGDTRLARGELDLLGVGERSAPREVLWASALLFARAGAPTQSHGVLRSAATTTSATRTELTEWLEHYPAGKWRAAWELAFPRPFADVVTSSAAQAGIPESLAYAIMREESAFEPRVVSSAQAVGLMQLIVPTAKRMAKPLNLPSDTESLKKPAVNIPLGCRYLGQLRKQFPDNVLLSIPGYNAGGGAPKKWLDERSGYDFDVWVERIPYDETQKYTKRVMGTMAAYEWLYWQDRPTEARATPLAAGPAPSAIASVAAPAGAVPAGAATGAAEAPGGSPPAAASEGQ